MIVLEEIDVVNKNKRCEFNGNFPAKIWTTELTGSWNVT